MFKHVFLATLFLVLAACSPSQIQLTPTPEITQTNTLAPTQTETPEPTATQTATPSPTQVATYVPQYPALPSFSDFNEEVKEWCELVPGETDYDDVNLLASQAAGREVHYVLAGEIGPEFAQIAPSFAGPGNITCQYILWTEDEVGFGASDPHPAQQPYWQTWPFRVIAVFYSPQHELANEDGYVIYEYIPTPSQ